MSETSWRCGCGQENRGTARFCDACGVKRSTASAGAADAQERPDRTGEILDDRFRLSRRLGEGGMGEVYLAQDERLGRQVAIKLLAPELTSSPRAWERMWQEGQTLARIDDVNVVKVFDLFETQSLAGGRTLAMAMEYLPGGDLRDRLRQGPLPTEEACAITSGVLSGLSAIHAVGLVHRDLKPGNVLVAQNGTPKVADLGVARDLSGRMQTRTGQVIGTAEYMSPEQVRGEAVNEQSDIYAAGLLLHELIVGRIPFAGKTDFELQVAHVQTEPDLATLRGRANSAVVAVVERALKKDASQRFESAQAMRAALASAVSTPTPRVITPMPAPSSPSAPAPAKQAESVYPYLWIVMVVVLLSGRALWQNGSPTSVPADAKPENELVGVWTVDVDALAESEDIKKLEGEAKTQALEMAKAMLANMSFEFTRDGKIKIALGEMRQEGTYTVVRAEGNDLTLSTRVDNKDETITVSISNSKLTIRDPSGKPMVLRRR